MRRVSYLAVLLTGAFLVGCGSQEQPVQLPVGPLPGDMIDAQTPGTTGQETPAPGAPTGDAPAAPEAKKDEAAAPEKSSDADKPAATEKKE